MISLDISLGALELGILLSSVLYGVVTMQAFVYACRKTEDPIWLRLTIVVVRILDTLHIVCAWILLYTMTVKDYGVAITISELHWSLLFAFLLSSVICFIVQCYNTYRVRVLAQDLVFATLTWLCTLLRCGFSLATFSVTVTKHVKTYNDLWTHHMWLLITPLAMNVIIDALNASASCFHLRSQRSSSESSKRVIDQLVMYVVVTEFVTFLLSVAILSTITTGYPMLSSGLFLVYPRLYSISLLFSLNSRPALRQTYAKAQTSLTDSKPTLRSISMRSFAKKERRASI